MKNKKANNNKNKSKSNSKSVEKTISNPDKIATDKNSENLHKIRINEIKRNLSDKTPLATLVAKQTGIKLSDIRKVDIIRESIDARKSVIFKLTVDVTLNNFSYWKKRGFQLPPSPYIPFHERPENKIYGEGYLEFACETSSGNQLDIKESSLYRPIIIGFGPAGIFAALQLAYLGLKPIVIEQGEDVDARKQSVEEFWSGGELKENTNVQFGEGGAGTFSDGKLTTRVKDERMNFVINELIKAGAPMEIAYKAHPHIGTDLLYLVVKNIREKIISLGGKVHFSTKVTDLFCREAKDMAIETDKEELTDKENETYLHIKNIKSPRITVKTDKETFVTNHLVIATGHSGREMYQLLVSKGFALEPKPFAVGVRIEHPQKLIDYSQYGEYALNKELGAAEYKLTHTTIFGRSVYSFCMCPGGLVVASSSEKGGVVVNGMSYHARDGQNANSAMLVNVQPSDYMQNDDVLGGMFFQRKLEKRAFEKVGHVGNGSYHAPAQRLSSFFNECYEDFILGTSQESSELLTKDEKNQLKNLYEDYLCSSKALSEDLKTDFTNYTHTYRPGITFVSLRNILPSFVRLALFEGIMSFGRKIHGFNHPDVIITAVESRSSAPVRILRDKDSYESLRFSGVYPAGEGAGYAGGITSSALDGVKVAEAIFSNYFDI